MLKMLGSFCPFPVALIRNSGTQLRALVGGHETTKGPIPNDTAGPELGKESRPGAKLRGG